MFAFADRDHVTEVVTAAGWAPPRFEKLDRFGWTSQEHTMRNSGFWLGFLPVRSLNVEHFHAEGQLGRLN
jgi:hypothetical protein